MAIPAPRQLRIGNIVDKTFGVMEYNAVTVALYVAALTLATTAIKYFSLGMTAPLELVGIALGQFVVGIAAAYFLLDTMIRKTGLRTRSSDDVFFAFVGLSILYTIGVGLGLIVIIIPGLLIMARWSVAQPMLVARGGSPVQTLGESWERTRGNEVQILLATLAVLIVPIAVLIAAAVMFDPENLIGIAISQFASSATSALGCALGVALYGLMEAGRADVAAPA